MHGEGDTGALRPRAWTGIGTNLTLPIGRPIGCRQGQYTAEVTTQAGGVSIEKPCFSSRLVRAGTTYELRGPPGFVRAVRVITDDTQESVWEFICRAYNLVGSSFMRNSPFASPKFEFPFVYLSLRQHDAWTRSRSSSIR